jgi:hypothetical protein
MCTRTGRRGCAWRGCDSVPVPDPGGATHIMEENGDRRAVAAGRGGAGPGGDCAGAVAGAHTVAGAAGASAGAGCGPRGTAKIRDLGVSDMPVDDLLLTGGRKPTCHLKTPRCNRTAGKQVSPIAPGRCGCLGRAGRGVRRRGTPCPPRGLLRASFVAPVRRPAESSLSPAAAASRKCSGYRRWSAGLAPWLFPFGRPGRVTPTPARSRKRGGSASYIVSPRRGLEMRDARRRGPAAKCFCRL